MNLEVYKLSPEATLPTRGTDHAAGYDLYSLNGGSIQPRARQCVATGIAIKMPVILPPLHVYGSIRSRSGLSARKGIEAGAGVIDHDYTGEIVVVLHNHGDDVYKYEPGTRIAQLVLEVHIRPAVLETAESFRTTIRGSNGFGSTGQ